MARLVFAAGYVVPLLNRFTDRGDKLEMQEKLQAALQAANAGTHYCAEGWTHPLATVVQVVYVDGVAQSVRVGRRNRQTIRDTKTLNRALIREQPAQNTPLDRPVVGEWLAILPLQQV